MAQQITSKGMEFMPFQEIIAILLTITAVASYVNYRYFKLSDSIGLTIMALVVSLLFMLSSQLGFQAHEYARRLVASINFNETFMGGMLSLLLFAGALQINVIELAKHKLIIFILSTLGVALSTFLVGFAVWGMALFFNIPLRSVDCLLFGALIAPTDPIAVLGILKRIKAPHSLSMPIAGEALFNDGVSIVFFLMILRIASGFDKVSHIDLVIMLARQLVGGLLVGSVLGFFTSKLLQQIDRFELGFLMTLALTTGGYFLASELSVSAPIAIVVAGLIIGHNLKASILSLKLSQSVQVIWTLIDSILNAILFVLIGLVVFQLSFSFKAVLVALFAIPMVLVARYISVAFPLAAFARVKGKLRATSAAFIFTWGGLRGGISIALALSLPVGLAKNEILIATYFVVVFSLVVQGISLNKVIRRAL